MCVPVCVRVCTRAGTGHSWGPKYGPSVFRLFPMSRFLSSLFTTALRNFLQKEYLKRNFCWRPRCWRMWDQIPVSMPWLSPVSWFISLVVRPRHPPTSLRKRGAAVRQGPGTGLAGNLAAHAVTGEKKVRRPWSTTLSQFFFFFCNLKKLICCIFIFLFSSRNFLLFFLGPRGICALSPRSRNWTRTPRSGSYPLNHWLPGKPPASFNFLF